MRKILFCFCLCLLISGCAVSGTLITGTNNHIHMPSYSFVAPPDEEWYVDQPSDPYETVAVRKQMGRIIFMMQFKRNTAFNPVAVRGLSARDLATDYRNAEKNEMIEQGVKKGMYVLSDLKMGEEEVGGKTFYTMDYVVTRLTGIQRASLYLYSPPSSNNESFILAHYSETNASPTLSFKKDFLSVLATLSPR